MSFRMLETASAASSRDHNSTAGSITQLPVNILEAFIPGYSIISRFLLEVLGFDITVVVSICFLLFGLLTSIKYLYKHAHEYFKTYFMSFISISSDDDIFEHVMDWLGEQPVSRDSISLMARTGHYSWDADEVDDFDESIDTTELLDFSNWDSKNPPKFQPYFGKHRFWHKGRYFELRRETKQMVVQNGYASMLKDEETLCLSCVGRSAQPIKDLIKECQGRYFSKKSSRTTVRRPATKEIRTRGRNPWTKVAKRPSRPMDTVVLEHDQKEQVLADINEYLHPASPRWYANRGIPYRRGYLFHGPPGTGKSSLSFAIAGTFGLDIYCISLLEPSLTEEDLSLLFNHLPRRCVVLLEDIDSAGLVRRDADTSQETAAPTTSNNKESNVGNEIARAIKSATEKGSKDKDKTQGISLSGLLNAIDGVASHEGRVLVMTTNFPDKLDDALIRPGRVDMSIAFNMASRSQIRKLFVRMYAADNTDRAAPSKIPADLARHANGDVNADKMLQLARGHFTPPVSPTDPSFSASKGTFVSPAQLEEIADAFAALLPEQAFSPAEIQGFLLTRKKEPRRALREVETWMTQLLEAKATKARVASA